MTLVRHPVRFRRDSPGLHTYTFPFEIFSIPVPHRWIQLVKVTTLSKGDVLKYSVFFFFLKTVVSNVSCVSRSATGLTPRPWYLEHTQKIDGFRPQNSKELFRLTAQGVQIEYKVFQSSGHGLSSLATLHASTLAAIQASTQGRPGSNPA